MTNVTTYDFRIVNFPYICSNIPESSTYGVYISQLIRYERDGSSYGDFIESRRLLIKKLVDQGYIRLKNGRYIFESFMVDTMIWYTTLQYSPFAVFV